MVLWVFTPDLVAGTAILGLALWLMLTDAASRQHHALALLFTLRGAYLLAIGLQQPNDAFQRFVPYVLIAMPFAAANFALVFRWVHGRPHALHPWLRLGLLVACAAFCGAYLLDHGLYEGAHYPYTPGPFYVAPAVAVLSVALVGLVMARQLHQERVGAAGNPYFLLTLAFTGQPLYVGLLHLASPEWNTIQDGVSSAVYGATVVVCVAALAMAWPPRRIRGEMGESRRVAVATVGLAGVASAAAVAYAVSSWTGFHQAEVSFVHTLLDSLWVLAMVAMAAFAIAHYRVFSLELQAKAVVREGSTVLILAALFFFVEHVLEDNLPWDNWERVLAAGSVALTVWPLHYAAAHLANRLMPHVHRTAEYRHRRRLEIYNAAYSRAAAHGDLSHHERRALSTLARDLGLSAEDVRIARM